MSNPIPLLCDRCRAEGVAGEGDFAASADLLDFEPVPRKKKRADGWTPEVQRAFILALAATGSARRAAAAVGKAQFGADQLRRADGNHGFLAAWDRALACFREKSSLRIAAGVEAVAGEGSAWSPPPAPWSRAASRRPVAVPARIPAPDPDDADRILIELLEIIVRKYSLKLDQERRARLEGRVAEADFYIRQVTALEVAMDVTSGDGMAVLKAARRGDHDLLVIAETTMSKLLDAARRDHWEQCGDPPRPEPPLHLFEEQDGYSIEPLEAHQGGSAQSREEQRRALDEQHARDAREQIAWEAEQRRGAAP